MTIADRIKRAKSDYDEVYEGGKVYAYDNPQTPTDNRTNLAYWYQYLNADSKYDVYDWNDEISDWVYPEYLEENIIDSLPYPQGTQNATVFTAIGAIVRGNDAIMMTEWLAIPVRRFLGTLDLTNAEAVNRIHSYNQWLEDAGTIIPPKNPEVGMARSFQGCPLLKKIRFIGEIQCNISFGQSPLDSDTIRHIVSILSDTVTGKTLTLNKNAVEAAMPWDIWDELIATKTNWTIELV
ncbi:MAG: hypothetical protein IKL36_00500 [Clostridia bacterium]|nr:hypothetical protein [Clostridia bacterium]